MALRRPDVESPAFRAGADLARLASDALRRDARGTCSLTGRRYRTAVAAALGSGVRDDLADAPAHGPAAR